MIVCDTNDNSLRERERLPRESELTLPEAMSASHAAEETHEHAHKILNKMRPSICTRFQNTENLEAKTSLKLQR